MTENGSSEILILPATEEDLPEIEKIEQECFSVPLTLDQLRSQLPGNMHAMWKAQDKNGPVLGYVGLTYVLDEGDINNVAVTGSARRRGVGSALLEAVLAFAKERDFSFVTLEVRESNAPAIGLYKKYGFKNVGRRKKYYEKPREDAIIMAAVFHSGE